MQARVARLGHIGLTVRDLDRTIAFYETYLGLKLTERFAYPPEKVGHGTTVAAGAFMRCDVTHHELSIFTLRPELMPEAGPEGPAMGLHHIAFEMATPADLLALHDRMRGDGVTIVNSRRGGPGNQPRFYARDPDGNLLEFYWGIDKIGWQGRPRAYDPIQEIDLHSFDFDGFVSRREADAANA